LLIVLSLMNVYSLTDILCRSSDCGGRTKKITAVGRFFARDLSFNCLPKSLVMFSSRLPLLHGKVA